MMAKRNRAAAVLCLIILMIFAYSFWIGARNTPQLGGSIEASE
jgi:hypothetical protein